jgi:hypothetical protein
MADAILAGRGQDPPPLPVGKNWVSRFVCSQSKLQTKWNRKFHSQRARCEGLITYCLDRVLLSLTVVRTPSLLATTVDSNIA